MATVSQTDAVRDDRFCFMCCCRVTFKRNVYTGCMSYDVDASASCSICVLYDVICVFLTSRLLFRVFNNSFLY